MGGLVAAARILFLIPIAYACACCVAAIVPAFVLQPIVSLAGAFVVLAMALLAAWIIAVLALVPMLALVVLAEVFGWRARWMWIPAGAVIGLLFFLPGAGAYADLLGELGVIPTHMTSLVPPTRGAEVAALTVVGGLLGGWVYWSMAGRYSGIRGAGVTS